MFNFGSPEVSASMLVEANVFDSTGPEFPMKPVDEMTMQELKNANAYLYMSVRKATRDGVDGDVMSHLLQWYLEVFTEQARQSMEFRAFVVTPAFNPPDGFSRKPRYLEIIAGLES